MEAWESSRETEARIEMHVGIEQGGAGIEAHVKRLESSDFFCVFCRWLRSLDAVIRVKQFPVF
jgi:hypothetical protein